MAYIDKDKFFVELEKAPAYFDSGDIRYGIDIAKHILGTLPIADVVEVKHGYWIENLYCSVCGNTYDTGEYHNDNDYCCRCGAKMDLKEVIDERGEDDAGT